MRRWPAPGRLVDVGGGRRVHVECDGEGQVRVVLIAGGGGLGWFWRDVRRQGAEALHATVCSYDRPGAGWSDALNEPYSIAAEAKTLNGVLDALGASEPVLIVGHSYGAFVAQRFTSDHRPRLFALILVDPNTVFFRDRQASGTATDKEQARKLRFTVPLGLARWSLRRQLAPAFSKRFPADAEMLVDILSTSKFMSAQVAQSLALHETFSALRNWTPAADLPVTVISRGKSKQPAEEEALWLEGHERLVRGHPLGHRIVAHDSWHDVPRDQPAVIVEELQRQMSQHANTPAIAK